MTTTEAKTRSNHYFTTLAVLAAIVVAVSLPVISAQGASGQTDPKTPPKQVAQIGESADSPRLLRKAEREGSVRVIVGLKTGFRPEGRLTRSQADEQRRDIAGARSGSW